MRSKYAYVIAFILFFAFSAKAAGLDNLDRLDDFVERAMKEYKVPGLSLAIVQDGKVIFAKGYGVRRVNSDEKVDKDTIFQLASVSKTFASAGLGVQVSQGVLGWDDEVIKHLPQAILQDIYAARNSTVRDLLAHRTGLPAFRGDLLGELGYTREEVLGRIRYIEPGSTFRDKAQYSNLNFFIAGELLAKLTGKDWESAVKSTLLDPLKMTRTGFTPILQDSNVALPHALIEGQVQPIERNTSTLMAAAGGVSSTAKDLGNWMIMHLEGGEFEGKRIIGTKEIEEMFAPSMVSEVSFTDLPPIDKHSSNSFGLGWGNYNYQGKTIIEKGGALDGVRSIITLIPQKNAGIAILANMNLTVLPELIRAKFLEEHLGKSGLDLEKEFQRLQKIIFGIVEKPKRPENALPLGHELEKYEGSYTSAAYGTFKVIREGSSLQVKAGPIGYPGALIPWSNDSFLLKWPGIDSGYQVIDFEFGPEGYADAIKTESLGAFTRQKDL